MFRGVRGARSWNLCIPTPSLSSSSLSLLVMVDNGSRPFWSWNYDLNTHQNLFFLSDRLLMYSLFRDNISFVESHQSTGWKVYPFNVNLFNGHPVDLIIIFHIFLLDSLGSQTFNFHQAVYKYTMTIPTVIALILII